MTTTEATTTARTKLAHIMELIAQLEQAVTELEQLLVEVEGGRT